MVRLIPCLDLRGERVVKGKQFVNLVDVANPLSLVEYYCRSGADEIFLLDIGAAATKGKAPLTLIEQIVAKIKIPLTFGGGIDSIIKAEKPLKKGAAKVSVSSGALKNPGLIRQLSQAFGSKAVVLSIDAKKTGPKRWSVFTGGGRTDTGLDVLEWAREGARLGAGELLINSIDGDGMKDGYDLELLQAVTSQIQIPVIASGGAGKPEHFSAAVLQGGASGLLAATVFHSGLIQIPALKGYLQEKEIGVNLK